MQYVPLVEPVNRAAIDKSWEHSKTALEIFTDGREGKHNMNAVLGAAFKD